MYRAVLLVLAVLAGAPSRAAAPGRAEESAAQDERAFCATEADVVERRRRLFEAQGLSAAEIVRKNEQHLDALDECHERFRAEERRRREYKQDVDEVTRRVGPNATELERERVWREIRRDRLGSKSPSSLTAEEKAELAAGMGDEVAATHRALDAAHARDPRFMRIVHSALACYHGGRRDVLKELISSEESLLKLGTGDRQKLYALRSELAQSGAVLARSGEAGRAIGGLESCTSPTVAVVAHCLGVRMQGGRVSACESEEIQQFMRFVK